MHYKREENAKASIKAGIPAKRWHWLATVAPSYLNQRLRCVGENAIIGVDIGVWTGVEGGIDGREVGRYWARYQVALLQTPVAAVDAQAKDVVLLLLLVAVTQTISAQTNGAFGYVLVDEIKVVKRAAL